MGGADGFGKSLKPGRHTIVFDLAKAGGAALFADCDWPLRSAIISVCLEGTSMEAERLNQIAASLADLKARTDELRRYL